MADFLSLKIQGIDKMIDKFNRFSDGAINNVLDDCLNVSGELVLPVLQSNTPVDTGALRDSMHIEKEGLTIHIGPGDNLIPHYAADVEYGFHHWISGNFIEGRHYLERTAFETRDSITTLFKTKILEFFLS